MRSGFILSCESTIDLPYSYCEQRDTNVFLKRLIIYHC